VLAFVALGLAIGAGSSVLPGPCGLAVLSAACTHGVRRAYGTAIGVAIGDAAYAALGILGVNRVLVLYPQIPPVLRLLSSIGIIVYGVMQLRQRQRSLAPTRTPGKGDRRGRAGIATGLALLLANPAAILTWCVIVGSQLPPTSPLEGLSIVLGIGAGTFVWYAGVATLSSRGQTRSASRMTQLTRLVASLLICYGALIFVHTVGAM
jgi:threonine/homoserine/homoserine lactone efflux protein